MLQALASERGWDADGPELYDDWDARNKAAQRTARWPTTFAEVSVGALTATYAARSLPLEHAPADLARLHGAVGDWPLWPDVADAVRAVAALPRVRGVGLLSNVDDALARRTRAASLVDADLLLTSQRLRAFKPDARLYEEAAAAVAPATLVHVAASARDVRGALEAGLATVRLARGGHALDPDGPRPDHEVTDAADLPAAIAALAR